MCMMTNREDVVKGLWVLQKRGLIEYALSVPAMYVTLNTQACFEDYQRSRARRCDDDNRGGSAVAHGHDRCDNSNGGGGGDSGDSGDSGGGYYNRGRAVNRVDYGESNGVAGGDGSGAMSVCLPSNTNSTYTGLENKENKNKDKENDRERENEQERQRESMNEWIWNLSHRVCAVLNQIDAGVSRRSGDMWRLGNVISSCCSEAPTGTNKTYMGGDPGSDLESAQEGVSSFLCHYLENLSGRSATYQSTPSSSLESKIQDPYLKNSYTTEGVNRRSNGKKVIDQTTTIDRDDGKEKDEEENGVNNEEDNENLSLTETWERKFFLVPSPVQDLNIDVVTDAESSSLPCSTSSMTGSGGDTGLEGIQDIQGPGQGHDTVTQRTAGGNRGSDRSEVTKEGDDEEIAGGTAAANYQMNLTNNNIQEEEEQEEVKILRSEIKKLSRDIIMLSMDSRLQHVKNRIAHPVVTAFSPPPLSRHHTTSTSFSTSSSARMTHSKPKRLNLNGRLSWKQAGAGSAVSTVNQGAVDSKYTQHSGVSVGEQKTSSMGEIGEGVGAGAGTGTGTRTCVSTDVMKDLIPQGERELLALLITRILHGLPSKLLTAAAWREHSAAWGAYRGCTFLSVLNAANKILAETESN